MRSTARVMIAGLAIMGLGAIAQAGDIYSITADGQTFDAYFEEHDGQSWLLIGRGRKNWEFDTDGHHRGSRRQC